MLLCIYADRNMQYELFSTEDFIRDEAFQQWVFSPNKENSAFWEELLFLYPGQRPKVEEARQFLLALRPGFTLPSDEVLLKMKSSFNAKIDAYEAARSEKQKTLESEELTQKKSKSRRLYLPIAASLLLVSVFLVGYVLTRTSFSDDVLHALTHENERTPQGKQRLVILADGTRIWLNAGSELSFPKDFSEKPAREVYLEGEAFFSVAEDKSKPFIVHASDLDIRVLGTSFNVRSYAGEDIVETTLVTGKVALQYSADSSRQVTLLPNQHALFRKNSKTISLEAVNANDYAAWRDGWMIFDDKPFGYIKETLERWYNVKIVIEDESSLSCTFSARFKDMKLEEVLEIFKNTESINYRIEGKMVFIDGKLCDYDQIN